MLADGANIQYIFTLVGGEVLFQLDMLFGEVGSTTT